MADVASDVTIGMLGPLEVRVGFGEPVEVVGPRLRTLVIGLAIDPDRVVLASQLIDAVWDGTAGGVTNAPGPPTPGPRSASTRRRPPARSSAAGSAATCRASSLAG
jgi:hypothetical protein